MRGSFIILGFFVLGLLIGRLDLLYHGLNPDRISTWVIYLLMFLVGVGVGADKKALRALVTINLKIFWIPVGTIAGTLAGMAVLSLFIRQLSVAELMAVGSGFGYYSLSSVIITEMHSAELGVIALLSNVIREIITLLFAPLFMVLFSKLAPIAAGGATSMDTTLPVITQASGKEFALMALFHGIVLSILVPFLVSFWLVI
ncbi:MAG: lysine exporter LysO family protein [Bacteroidales bacterium]